MNTVNQQSVSDYKHLLVKYMRVVLYEYGLSCVENCRLSTHSEEIIPSFTQKEIDTLIATEKSID